MANEQKPQEQMEMERAAEELERKIVRFTNIDKESFTHSYRGISTTVAPGASQVMRFPEADHLATHLARKILSRATKALKRNEERGVALWTEKEVSDLKKKILSEVGQTSTEKISPEEQHKIDLANLDKNFGGGQQSGQQNRKTPTKKDVIKALEAAGQPVDEKKSLDELLAQLLEFEKNRPD